MEPEVSDIELQPEQLNAKVTLSLRSDKKIPYNDTSARILTQGLLGSFTIRKCPYTELVDGVGPHYQNIKSWLIYLGGAGYDRKCAPIPYVL